MRVAAAVTGVDVNPPAVNPGSSVTLTAHTTGDLADVSPYQWYKQDPRTRLWVALTNEISSTLILPSVAETDDTYYKVKVFGKVNGGVDSAATRVTVNDAVAFAAGQKLQTMSLVGGESTAFSVSVTGFDPHFQWYFRRDAASAWVAISGATASSYSITAARPQDDGFYGVIVSNAFSQAGATRATPTEPLTAGRAIVHVPPQFADTLPAATGSVLSPSAGLAVADEGASFRLSATVLAGGAVPVTYQWRKDGVAIAAAAGSVVSLPAAIELPLTAVTGANAGRYDLLVGNVYGVNASTPVNVVVNLRPAIRTQPQSITVAEGSSASFRVEADGDGVTYQWVRATSLAGPYAIFNDPVTGAPSTGRLLALSGLAAAGDGSLNGFYFKAIATNTIGSVESLPAKLTVTSADDLKIDVQPAFTGLSNGVALPGISVASLSVTAHGSGTLAYQWRKNGIAIPGATLSSYTLPLTTNDSAGVYDVFISNDANFVYSTPQTLIVEPHLDAVSIPDSVNPGDGARLEAKVTSASTVTYQWYRRVNNGARTSLAGLPGVSGASSAALVFESVQLSDDAEYQVEVSTTAATQTSPWKRMVVVTKVAITAQPVALTRLQDTAAQLSVSATGGGTLAYRWIKDGVSIAESASVTGTTTAQLSFQALRLADEGSYQVEVSNPAGAVLSVAAYVKVTPKFDVTVASAGRVSVGQGASLVATVQGASSVSYQWFRGSGATRRQLAGETGAQLRINPVLATDAGLYTVEVTNANGATVQASATLELSRTPELLVGLTSQTVALGSPAVFAVVVKYDRPLTYQWYRGTGAARTLIAGAINDKLRIAAASASDFATYTVRVTASDNTTLSVESSARLVQKVGTTTGSVTTTGTGAVGTVAATSFTRWWVYWADAVDASAPDTAAHQSGYWVLERSLVRDASNTVVSVSAGRSAWVWANELLPAEWLASQLQVQDASANAKSEFSVIATHDADTDSFTINGTVEAGTDAAWFGAPEIAAGAYDKATSVNLDLSWDLDQVNAVQGFAEGEWENVLSFLKSALTSQAAALPGE